MPGFDKISKKHQTPESIAAEHAQILATKPRSQHFEPGNFVLYEGQRYEIAARPGGGWLLVMDKDGGTYALRPYALSYER
jgi:hypothetical protein